MTVPGFIGRAIRRARLACGETLQEFAARSGIPWNTLQAYETGRAEPPAGRFLRIVHAARRRQKHVDLTALARGVDSLARAA